MKVITREPTTTDFIESGDFKLVNGRMSFFDGKDWHEVALVSDLPVVSMTMTTSEVPTTSKEVSDGLSSTELRQVRKLLKAKR